MGHLDVSFSVMLTLQYDIAHQSLMTPFHSGLHDLFVYAPRVCAS
jgi:hypothetical protein